MHEVRVHYDYTDVEEQPDGEEVERRLEVAVEGGYYLYPGRWGGQPDSWEPPDEMFEVYRVWIDGKEVPPRDWPEWIWDETLEVVR